MKQCPVCKTTYTDQSLRFCLADGASLQSISDAEEPTLISAGKNPQLVSPNNVATPNNQPKKRSVIPFIIAGVVGLAILLIAGISVVALIAFYNKSETSVVSNIASEPNRTVIQNTSKPVIAGNSAAVKDELKEKLANLQKQLEEQKNQNSSKQPFPEQKADNYEYPTARVAPSNDGFLSLRTEPSVRTGTQLVKIPSGATVQLENCEKNQTTIDGRRGRWCMISYGGETGWAFDAWLIY